MGSKREGKDKSRATMELLCQVNLVELERELYGTLKTTKLN